MNAEITSKSKHKSKSKNKHKQEQEIPYALKADKSRH